MSFTPPPVVSASRAPEALSLDPLDGRQVDACLHEVRDGRVAESMTHHLTYIETRRRDNPAKRLFNVHGVSGE